MFAQNNDYKLQQQAAYFNYDCNEKQSRNIPYPKDPCMEYLPTLGLF